MMTLPGCWESLNSGGSSANAGVARASAGNSSTPYLIIDLMVPSFSNAMTIRYAELAAANTSVAQRHRAGKSGGILGDHSPRRSPLEPDSARQAEFDATRQSSMRCQLRG